MDICHTNLLRDKNTGNRPSLMQSKLLISIADSGAWRTTRMAWSGTQLDVGLAAPLPRRYH